jgi:hypothetical protein
VAGEAARVGVRALVAQDVDEDAVAAFGVKPLDRLVEDVFVVQWTGPFGSRSRAAVESRAT